MCLSDGDKEACIETPVDIVLHDWFHYCFVITKEGNGIKIVFYQNGEKIMEGKFNDDIILVYR